MRLESRKYLYDIIQAAKLLLRFATGKSMEDYLQDELLRSAVERQLEIIGEALARLVKVEGAVGARITEHRRIIAFRNILAHGYAQVDHRIVWDVLQNKLPALLLEAEALLSAGEPSQE